MILKVGIEKGFFLICRDRLGDGQGLGRGPLEIALKCP